MDTKLLANIGLNTVDAIIFILFFISFTSQKKLVEKNRLKCAIYGLIYIIACAIISVCIPLSLDTVVIMAISIPLLSYFSKTNMSNTAFAVVFTAFYLIILYVVIFFIFLIVLSVPPEGIVQNPTYRTMIIWVSKAVQLTLAVIIYVLNNRSLKINITKSSYNIYLLMVLQLFILIIIILGVSYGIGYYENKQLFVALLCALYILSIVLSIYNIRERDKVMKLVYKKQILEEYVKNLEDVVKVIRCEKHDFMNHLQTIYALCRLNKPNALESIENYLKKFTSSYERSYDFYNTGNDYVDGLLAIKSHLCFENDIKLSVSTDVELPRADIDEENIAGIMGNILDNAIESILSLGNVRNMEKEITIRTYINNDLFYLSISNNGPQIPHNFINHIFEQGITSKAGNSERGYGLFITKQLITRNNSNISVSSDSEKTEFIVTLNVRKELVSSDSNFDQMHKILK